MLLNLKTISLLNKLISVNVNSFLIIYFGMGNVIKLAN